VMILDNSGSMQAGDGTKLVQGSHGKVHTVKCSRWKELVAEVEQVAEVSSALSARTDFHLLNPTHGFAAFSINGDEEGASIIPPVGPTIELATFKEAIKTVGPQGSTPLTEAIMSVVTMVEPVQHELRRRGERVTVIIATDGLPNNRATFLRAMQMLQTLPVWVVVRLCTDDDSVVEYWNDLDTKLEAPLEVLDDVMGEANEVWGHNPFVTYAPALHLARLFGLESKLYDALDETRLLPSQIKELIEDIIGCGELPEPEIVGPKKFAGAVRDALGEAPMLVMDPRSGKMKPWIDGYELERALKPKGELPCVIM